MGMDIDPADETSYTAQYQQEFVKQVENKFLPQMSMSASH